MSKKRVVRQVFKASVWCGTDAQGGVYAYLDLNSPILKSKEWIDGDRVRVTVERLPRKRRKGQ